MVGGIIALSRDAAAACTNIISPRRTAINYVTATLTTINRQQSLQERVGLFRGTLVELLRATFKWGGREDEMTELWVLLIKSSLKHCRINASESCGIFGLLFLLMKKCGGFCWEGY